MYIEAFLIVLLGAPSLMLAAAVVRRLLREEPRVPLRSADPGAAEPERHEERAAVTDPARLDVLRVFVKRDCRDLSVPELLRALEGPQGSLRSLERAREELARLAQHGLVDFTTIREDHVPASARARYLPGADGVLFAVASLRVSLKEAQKELARVPAPAPPQAPADADDEIHYVATGYATTACGCGLGQVASGLVGKSGRIGWTTHGAAATCPICRCKLGLPPEAPVETSDDEGTRTIDAAARAKRTGTLVSEGTS